jgi:hypothetical protein
MFFGPVETSAEQIRAANAQGRESRYCDQILSPREGIGALTAREFNI